MKKNLIGEVVDESKFSVFNKVDKEELKRREPVIDESTVALVKPSGFVLVDFPNTYEQAVMLERLMTGFLPKDHIVLTENELKKQEMSYLIVSSEKNQPQEKLISSGFDRVISIESTTRECLERAFGHLKVPGSDRDYHLMLNPPPTNESPLIETLCLDNKTERNAYLLSDKNKTFTS
jgi:hypothetical protein